MFDEFAYGLHCSLIKLIVFIKIEGNGLQNLSQIYGMSQ